MPRIHADLTAPAHVDADTLDWVASPVAGVDRRRLERVGDEIARVTSLVRYAPNSSFTAHTHGGGEEFLVLRGVFGDEHGDYPEGTYVRNPVGSAHTPRIGPRGCLILVKLWWMHPEDDERVVVDTHDPARWRQTPYGARLDLFASPRERVALLRLAPGQTWAPQEAPGGDELFVLSGEAHMRATSLARHHWLRRPGEDRAPVTSGGGALLYVKSGHLGAPPPLPEQVRA